jgi:choline dehydrogenase
MMEGPGGASTLDVTIRDGRRQSVFRSYMYPYMDHANLTVLTDALVTRIVFKGKRATAVEFWHAGKAYSVRALNEIVLSMGAVNTPKVLMQSGIGDEADLRNLGIPVVQNLPGVGKNFQDHLMIFGCVWEYRQPSVVPNGARALLYWKSDASLDTPDLQILQTDGGGIRNEMRKSNLPPKAWWSIAPSVVRPKSRGELRLSGAGPLDPIQIRTNMLSEPEDMQAALAAIELCREIGNRAEALRPFVKRELIPGNLTRAALEDFIRRRAVSYWHQACTAKMGRDDMSVVDGNLKVYGVSNLRIADASVMPRVTTGNTMAPCVVIGERAAEILRREHKLGEAV